MMSEDEKGCWVHIGEVPVDLNAGMIDAVTNPPQGFASKHKFVESDVVSRIKSIKDAVVTPLIESKLVPFQIKHKLHIAVVSCVQWEILGALMENSYMSSGHSVFFFLELLSIYEAGHFPCGWEGEWPRGKLRVF